MRFCRDDLQVPCAHVTACSGADLRVCKTLKMLANRYTELNDFAGLLK